MGIFVEHLDIEIRIRGNEVEDIALPEVSPVFPTNIPTFYQHLVKTVLGCEVDITLHLLVVGTMNAIRLHLCPVDLVEFDAGVVVGIVPGALTHNHLPPYATVFRGMDPRGILDLTRFIEVEDEVIGEHITCVVRYHHSTPRCLTRCLHRTFQTSSIRSEVAHERKDLRQRIRRWLRIGSIGIRKAHQLLREMLGLSINELKVHGGIIQASSLVDVDVKSVITLHLESGLHTRLREHSHRRVVPVDSLLETLTDTRELGLLGYLLLSVIVARKPPCGMIASHRKLRALFLDDEIVQLLLLGELITESDTIVVDTETDDNLTFGGRLKQSGSKLVVVVTDGGCLTPYGFPGLIERRGLFLFDLKTIHQISLVRPFRRVTILSQFQSKV